LEIFCQILEKGIDKTGLLWSNGSLMMMKMPPESGFFHAL